MVDHLFTQGTRASAGGACRYRTPDGLKCAVGVLIKDDEYDRKMESNSVFGLEYKGLLPSRLVFHLDLLCDLQGTHDAAGSWAVVHGLSEAGLRELRETADRFALSTQAIDRHTAVLEAN